MTQGVSFKGGEIINELYVVVMIRFLLIVVCSLLIGVNRGMMNQFAGVKTHLFVGIGAGLSFLVPFIYYSQTGITNMDPFRLPAQVISGIGFLGAGTIIKSGQSIKGLTTAAGLWTTAIISIAIASGVYITSLVATAIVFLFLMFGTKIDITKKYSTVNLTLLIKDFNENIDEIDKFMKKNSTLQNEYMILEHIKNGTDTLTLLRYEIRYRQSGLTTNEIMKELSQFNSVEKMYLVTDLIRI